MDNFFSGVQNIWMNILNTFSFIIHARLVWGFLLGFGVSTMIHLFIMSEDEKKSTPKKRASIFIIIALLLLVMVSLMGLLLG